jgi:hypothetical protein
MIEWTKIKDPKDGVCEYEATVSGIHFYIHKASDAGFGITILRLSDKQPLVGTDGRICWLRTRKKCVSLAERVLERETATHGGFDCNHTPGPSGRDPSPF